MFIADTDRHDVLLYHSMCPLLCVACSLLEEKVDQLKEMTTQNTQRLQEREDSALQYRRCV